MINFIAFLLRDTVMLQGLLNTVHHFTAKEQILAVYGIDLGKSAEWVIQYDESSFSF